MKTIVKKKEREIKKYFTFLYLYQNLVRNEKGFAWFDFNSFFRKILITNVQLILIFK